MFDNGYIPINKLRLRLGLPKKYLQDLAERGDIPSLIVNDRRRFNENHVRAALAKRSQNPTGWKLLTGGKP
jgi:hypothetical protein